MAKYDSQFSRVAAVDDDEAIEALDRPAGPSKARSALRPPEYSGNIPRPRPGISEDEERAEDTFLRARRRVPVRRGLIPSSRNGRILMVAIVILAVGTLIALVICVLNFLRSDPRLRIDSAANIQIAGNSQVTRPELLSIFGSDIGRNIFFVPLEQRRREMEMLPWVRSATVMRLLPNQLRVSIVERVPVAFLRNGNSVGLVDADGVLLDLSPAMMAARHYSFPVVTGITASDPLSLRAARMHFYQQFIGDLDSRDAKVSAQLSEVDVSDPEDIRALLPAQGSDILVHFGEGEFSRRYERYQQHIDAWRHQYPSLSSVDLRYDNQVVLGMGKSSPANPAAIADDGTDSETAVHVATPPRPKPGRPVTRHAATRHQPAAHVHKSRAAGNPKQHRPSKGHARHTPVRSQG